MDTHSVFVKSFFVVFFFWSGQNLFAQVTLEEVLSQVRTHAPGYALKDLIAAENDLQLKNINTTARPQLSVMAQATYQSEVTTIPISLPNFEIEPLSKDQYKIQAELSQNIYDGGVRKQQKKLQTTAAELDLLNVELELEKIREQTIPIYFSILEIDTRLRLLQLKQDDLTARQKTVKAAVENGSLLKMEAQSLEAAILLVAQQETELQAMRKAQVEILSILTGNEWAEDVQLVKPKIIPENTSMANKSISHQISTLRQLSLDQKEQLSNAARQPKLGAFIQGGYGKPGLNFLENEFSPYYILGARVQWNISGYYSKLNEQQILQLGKQKISTQQNAIDLQLNTQVRRYENEIEKLQSLIVGDEALLDLRVQIKNTAQVQLENGVITSADYLQFLNDENEVRLNKQLHEIQLLRNQYLLQHITSNYTIR